MSVAEEQPAVEVGTLTKQDVKMMKEADAIVFRSRGKTHEELESTINLQKNPRQDDAWKTETAVYDIACKGRMKYYISSEETVDRPLEVKCVAVVSSPRWVPEWQTVLMLLRAGDRVELCWTGNNGNQYTRQAGLHVDSLNLRVIRGKVIMEFALCHGVCQDNSARMVRRA